MLRRRPGSSGLHLRGRSEVQLSQPILPSKIYAPAGIALAKQSISDDLGVVGLGALPLGGLAVALSSVGGNGTPGAAVMYNMGTPAALTGLEAVPQDHVVQGFARCGPHMKQMMLATGKPGAGGSSSLWLSNEANTALTLRGTTGADTWVSNLAEYKPYAGADAGGGVMFMLMKWGYGEPYALPGFINVFTGAQTILTINDIPGNSGVEHGSNIVSARFLYLGDAVYQGSAIGNPAFVTVDYQSSYTRLEIGRSPDIGFDGPFTEVFQTDLPPGNVTVEAFSGYLGGTNCLALVGTGAAGPSYLYRSTDRGLTWAPAGSFPHSCSYGLGHIHWLNNLEVFLSIGRILYYSRDGGGSWRKIIDVGDEVTALTGMADGSIYAGTQNGVIHRYAPLYW